MPVQYFPGNSKLLSYMIYITALSATFGIRTQHPKTYRTTVVNQDRDPVIPCLIITALAGSNLPRPQSRRKLGQHTALSVRNHQISLGTS